MINFCLIIIILLLLFISNKKENFSVSLLKQHDLYTNLRNYIDCGYRNKPLNILNNYQRPYKISDNCFVDKYNNCSINNKHICQKIALNQCKFLAPISGYLF